MPTTQPATKKKMIKTEKVVNGVPTEVEIEVDDTAGPTWGPNDKHRILNTAIPRSDGPAKTTGTAIYTYDVRLPGMVHGRFVVSPHAHARVKKVDTSAAERIKGVLAVIPFGKEVRYEGEPVVAIAALTQELAEDAIRAVVIDWEILPHVVTVEDALQAGRAKDFHAGSADAKEGRLCRCRLGDRRVRRSYRSGISHAHRASLLPGNARGGGRLSRWG